MNAPLTQISAMVRIVHSTGLHARPSILFTQLASSFEADVQVSENETGPWINAKSIVKVMGLKAPFGTSLFIRAEGKDANSAVRQLCEMIENDFEDPIKFVNDVENADGA